MTYLTGIGLLSMGVMIFGVLSTSIIVISIFLTVVFWLYTQYRTIEIRDFAMDVPQWLEVLKHRYTN